MCTRFGTFSLQKCPFPVVNYSVARTCATELLEKPQQRLVKTLPSTHQLSTGRLAGTLVVALCFSPGALAQPTGYSVQVIPPPQCPFFGPAPMGGYGINATGQICGGE